MAETKKPAPRGRGKPGPAVFVGRTSGLVCANIEREVRVCRNVGDVAIGCGSLILRGDHARELLPRGNRYVRSPAAAAIAPGGFRLPRSARACGHQVRTADSGHILRIGWPRS